MVFGLVMHLGWVYKPFFLFLDSVNINFITWVYSQAGQHTAPIMLYIAEVVKKVSFANKPWISTGLQVEVEIFETCQNHLTGKSKMRGV